MKLIARFILFGIFAYFLISAVGFWWLIFGLVILVLIDCSK